MIKNIFLALILFLTGVPGSLSAKPVERIPMEDFFRLPEKTAWEISKNGEYISFLAPWKSRLNLFIQPLEGENEVLQVTYAEDRDIGSYFWANDTQLLYLKDFGGDENDHLFRVNKDGTELKDLTPFKGVKVRIIDELPDIDNELLIGMNNRDPKVFDAYRLNIVTGQLSLLAENPGNIQSWLTDHEGKLRCATAVEGKEYLTLFRDKEDDAFKEVFRSDYRESIFPVLFTFDNQRLYALSNVGRNTTALVVLDPKTRRETEVIYQHPEVDIHEFVYSRKNKHLTALSVIVEKKQFVFFDKAWEGLQRFIELQVPDEEMRLASWNKAENRFLIRSFSDKTQGAYYYYNTMNGEFRKLADVSPWILKEKMADRVPVHYKARDGLLIPGYLTLPRGLAAKHLPIVIHPHGGPQARDYWGFDPEVQFLANRGYGVLQMNYRGSDEYGRKFLEAGYKEWGGKMQDDITDGVKWLIQEGIADPRRVAIYGASYGGYAALAGLAFTPDLYACGISMVGVSNIFTMLDSFPPYWLPFKEMTYERIGHPEKDKERLRAASPLFHADQIKSPLFIAHGANDVRVKQAESDQIVESLRRRGVDVQYMVKDNEGHGFHNEENRFEFYKKLEEFLEQYIGQSQAQ